MKGLRRLRQYERVAQRSHFCDTCGREIHPGDSYSASVSVSEDREAHRICVYKEHLSPGCPDDFWDEEEERARECERLRREDQACERLERVAA